MDRALALEPEERYASAEEFRVALSDGARGVAPETSATRVVAPGTAATGVLSAATATAGPPGSATPVQQRQPIRPDQPRHQAAAAPPARAAAAAPPAARQRRRRPNLAPFIVLALALALGAGVVVWATRTSDTVRLRQVVYDNVDRTASELQQLIRQNTR